MDFIPFNIHVIILCDGSENIRCGHTDRVVHIKCNTEFIAMIFNIINFHRRVTLIIRNDNIFRTYSQHNTAAISDDLSPNGRNCYPCIIDNHAVSVYRDLKNVHIRRSDKLGYKNISRTVINLRRRIILLNHALVQNNDFLTDCHCLNLVMRYIDKGGFINLMDLDKLAAGKSAELGIQVGKRFIQQKVRRFFHQRTAKRHSLPLPAGEFTRISGAVLAQAEDIQRPVQPLLLFIFRYFGNLKAEQNIGFNSHMRIKSIILENHGDITILRLHFIDKLVIATGGRSYPSTGSTGDGYLFAKQFAHHIIETKPALCPIRIKEKVKKEGKIEPDAALSLMKPILFSLAVFHKFGYIHRDISGDNLLFTAQNQLKLIDFGAAREMNTVGEGTRTVIFKRGFAAEEQYREKGKQGAWTDVYGICAVFYFMLTGNTPIEAVERVIRDELPPLAEDDSVALPVEKKKIIDKGMAIFHENRYQTMEALYQDLYEEALDYGSVSLPEETIFSKKKDSLSEKKSPSHIEKANFLATRTEFLQKKQKQYESKRNEWERKKKKRRMLICALLFLVSAILLYIYGFQREYIFSASKKETGKNVEKRGAEAENTEVPVENTAIPAGNTESTEKPKEVSAATAQKTKAVVPNVLHFQKKHAVRLIKKKGFTYAIQREYNVLAKGKVVSQSISGGKKVKKGTKIILVVSRGKRTYVTPAPTKKPSATKKPGSSSTKKNQSDSKKSVDDVLSKDKKKNDITDLFD